MLLVFSGLALAEYGFFIVEVCRILTLKSFNLVKLAEQGPHEGVLIVKFKDMIQVKEGLVDILTSCKEVLRLLKQLF